MIKKILVAAVSGILLVGAAQADDLLSSKPASKFTMQQNYAVLSQLPFNDKQDFEFAAKGLIAKPKSKQIKNAKGEIVWDLAKFDFLNQDKFIASINPSLQRQAQLNMNYGLFKVTDRIYQVRGFDLTNITYIKGDTGWIIFDPLTVPESAKAAHALVTKYLGERPVKAVVYSHAHVDHFGGVKGVISQEQVDNGEVQVIAPRDFMEHVVKETVLAGNAMARRSSYQYGIMMPKNKYGVVDGALGKGVPTGLVGLITPTYIVEKDQETLNIDGVEMVFENAPNTESPSEMITWFPQLKTLWMAENTVAGMHNLYTIRGAQARDAATWSKSINQALQTYGVKADVLMASHHWPRWGKNNIVKYLEKQRDMYGYLHDQSLHLANKGVTINEIHDQFKMPEALDQEWYNRGYHGSVSHNVRGVVNKYIGYYDGNPATLNKLSPDEAGKNYVALAGGSEALLKQAKAAFDRGEYRWVAELMNHLVFAEPDNIKAKALQADTLEQLGYQAENAGWRNAYLAAAYELRNGVPTNVKTTTAGPDLITAMDTELVFDYMGVRLNAERALGKDFKINVVLPDRNEKIALELKNSHLNVMADTQASDAGLTLTLNREDLNTLLTKTGTFESLMKRGKVQHQGDLRLIQQFFGMLDDFEYGFNLATP
jgi:alkyl sulfatase BDS1-like metallo-beta-lactamase superfamily hydrolase